jgi:hypothetical protein
MIGFCEISPSRALSVFVADDELISGVPWQAQMIIIQTMASGGRFLLERVNQFRMGIFWTGRKWKMRGKNVLEKDTNEGTQSRPRNEDSASSRRGHTITIDHLPVPKTPGNPCTLLYKPVKHRGRFSVVLGLRPPER